MVTFHWSTSAGRPDKIGIKIDSFPKTRAVLASASESEAVFFKREAAYFACPIFFGTPMILISFGSSK